MTEVQNIPPKFTTVKYVTKDGEKCTATKKDGIVTVVGDKNGVRQVPLNDFMKEFVETLPKVDLARTPKKDTVQFSGAEEPAEEPQTPAEVPTSEEDKSVLINKKNLAIGSALTLIAGIGLYMFGRGRWWSKAAENAGNKGRELVDDITDAMKNGLRAGEKNSPERSVDEVVQGAEELAGKKPDVKVETPEIQKPKVQTEPPKVEQPKQPETTPAPKTEPPKTEAQKTENLGGAEKNNLRTTSPIPESEMFVIPKDLETNVEKIIQNGKRDNFPLIINGKQVYGYKLETPEGFSRIYFITDDKVILRMNEFSGISIIPFRSFEFAHGQVRSITDNTKLTLQKKFFHVEKPKAGQERVINFKDGNPFSIVAQGKIIELTPKEQTMILRSKKSGKTSKKQTVKKEQNITEQQKTEEIAKQKEQEQALERISQQQQEESLKAEQELARRQQESIDKANEDIINAAVIADMATEGASKGVKPITEGLNPDKMAKDIKGAADELFGPHPEKATDELFGPEAGKANEDLFAYNPSKQAERAVDDLEPKSDFETSRFNDDADDLFRTNEYDDPLISEWNNIGEDTYDIPLTDNTSYESNTWDIIDDIMDV